jgi:hypothetical protein
MEHSFGAREMLFNGNGSWTDGTKRRRDPSLVSRPGREVWWQLFPRSSHSHDQQATTLKAPCYLQLACEHTEPEGHLLKPLLYTY